MTKGRKQKSQKLNKNQLSLDFARNIPIEIHIPRQITVNYNREFVVAKKTMIELVRA
jgi:hypothetical protein